VYPNEDLCLFKNFPHERLVYPMLIPGKQLECTCTLYWLQSYAQRYDFKVVFDYKMSFQEYNQENSLDNVFLYCERQFNSSQCKFKQTFKMCHLPQEPQMLHKFSLENEFDIFYLIKSLEFILLVILQPTFCLIGIIHNGLTISVITNKNKKKEFQESMYKHILINAVFNIVYCVIMILKLLNTCIFYGSSVFCSSVYQEFWAQNLKIILIHFLGNVAKMCSNFSYLLFSLSRLLLLCKPTEKRQNRTNGNMLIFFYCLALILLSSILSAFKLFQYEANSVLNPLNSNKEFPFEIRDEHYCKDEMLRFQCKLFNYFKIANRLLNDVLFVILNISVDLILLIKFKNHMNRKLKHINDDAQHKVIQKSKMNINRMIFFNSLIYIFSHLPEFTMTLLLFIYAKKISNFCQNKFSCDLLNEEAEVFCLISIVCQFYVLKFFDKNFRKSFNEVISNLNCKFY
jgi:hypothetical protein